MQRKIRYALTLLGTAMVLVPAWFTGADAVRNSNGAWRILDVGANKPSIRKHHTMIYDPVYDRVILYAGETHNGVDHVVLNDLWKLDLGGSSPQWTELTLPNGPSVGRHGHSAAYGAGTMYVVTGLSDFSGTFSTDCLRLNLGAAPSWGNAFSHPVGAMCTDDFLPFNPRNHSAAAYVGSEVFLMGGKGPFGEPQFDTWGYNGSDWAWKSGYLGGGDVDHDHMQCLGFVPDARYWHTMINAAGKIVVFGGVYDTVPISNTFVSTNGVNWTNLGSAPFEPYNFTRAFHASVYDAVGGRMVVVGGYLATDIGQIVSDVTTLPVPQAGGQWTLLAPTGTAPGGISEHAAVYDSARDRVIVFGGVSTGGLRPNDTYVLEFADQTPPAAAFIGGGRGTTTATISWTAPGDDGTTGTAVEYDLRTSPASINASNFAQASQLSTPAPQPAGAQECVLLTGLTPGQKNYYALKTRDAAGNWSALSNVISITQRSSGNIEVECSGSGLVVGANATPRARALEYRIRGANPSSSGLTTLFVGIPDDRAGESMEISIFDVTGKRVRTIVQRTATPGEAEFTWDHRNGNGARVPGGVYFARLKLGSETRTQKVIATIAR